MKKLADAAIPTLVEIWLTDLRARQYANATIITRARDLRVFDQWCLREGFRHVKEIDRSALLQFRCDRDCTLRRDGRPLSPLTVASRISSLRLFFRWLVLHDVLDANPASEIELPRCQRPLPGAVLDSDECERVLRQPRLCDPLGFRDRVMLEVLYATGVRRSELAGLDQVDADLRRQTLMVRRGKGGRDRVVPLGARATGWIELYLIRVRPALAVPGGSEALFLTHDGHRFTPDVVSRIATRAITDADLGKRGSAHLFRHSMATQMLEGGADLRVIQEILGHQRLETTQIYTRISIRRLQEVHGRAHPGASLPPDGIEQEIASAELRGWNPPANRRDARLNRRARAGKVRTGEIAG